jgi:NADH-quinone oxidoreductase subunit E
MAGVVDQILADHNYEPSALIGILMDIQAQQNYLPPEDLERVAQKLEVPLPQVYSVATFYRAFSLTPRGKHIVSVCVGTACHVRGAKRVTESLERKLKIKAGETNKDLSFTLETVNCLGSCALGPLVVVDGKYHGKTDSGKMDKVINGCKKADREEAS